jgi:alpha-N-arabinofuranosidase
MKTTIRCTGSAGSVAPATLLGQNLEAGNVVVEHMLSDRLTNPTFTGPAHHLTGLAPAWQPSGGNNYAGFRYEITPGMGLLGRSAQMLHNFLDGVPLGVLQIGRFIRKGETLEVVLWARAQHHPVRLCVGLRPNVARAPNYDTAKIEVDVTYYKEYRATLQAPCDDKEAIFFCHLENEGLVWLDQIHLRAAGEGLLRRQLVEAFDSIHMPVLRFPGGCLSTLHHWKHGTGPAHLRPVLPDPVFKYEMRYEFGTDEYLAMCLDLGILPQITINLGTGTPEEAGEWAAYVWNWFKERKVDPPAMYWQMGNEHFGVWELGNMSGDLYAKALLEYIPAVKKGYPKARIIALGHDRGSIRTPEHTRLPWRKPVLERAGKLVDLLSFQYYPEAWSADKAEQHIQAMRGVQTASGYLREGAADCRARGLKTKVAYTEWHLWVQAAHYDGKGFYDPEDAQHALLTSSMLNEFTRLAPDLELANFYHLIDGFGVFLLKGPEVVHTLTAEVYKLYRPAFPGKVLPLKVRSGEMAKDLPAVDATALKTADGVWLFAINRSMTESADVELEGLPPVVEGQMLVGQTWDGGMEMRPADASANSLRLPPLAIARLKLAGRTVAKKGRKK